MQHDLELGVLTLNVLAPMWIEAYVLFTWFRRARLRGPVLAARVCMRATVHRLAFAPWFFFPS